MYNPVSTYRIQFHKNFNFNDFENIISYLYKLGVKTIYASPIFEAVPGSMHGYDITNPHRINPEIGTEEQLRKISKKLKSVGIGWLQDIVPNHMAYHQNNFWLMDILRNGNNSEYADFFDVNCDFNNASKRLMTPFLSDALESEIEKGKIKIIQQSNQFLVQYNEVIFPLRTSSQEKIMKQLNNENNIASINANQAFLSEIIDEQYYRFCQWQETNIRINYRRFFTVNGLICLNMQHKKVFQHYHQYIRQLIDEEVFQGLRIDHIDGLYDPKQYLESLRELTGPKIYIVVEKILKEDEKIPRNWNVQGNTGYDFFAILNQVFFDASGEKYLNKFYRKIAPNKRFHTELIEKKELILRQNMSGELENLTQLYQQVFPEEKNELIKEAIAAFLIYCPVYRYYGNRFPLSNDEADAIRNIFKEIAHNRQHLKDSVTAFESFFLENGDNDKVKKAHFYRRLMQFTGPLMAKGVEDTLMYTYNRFIGHNDVGDSPSATGLSIDVFHQEMCSRQEKSPLSLNASTTHDTKRGAGVHAKLNLLTEYPQQWIKAVTQWQKIARGYKQNNLPDNNEEYFIYQTLTGIYPPGNSDDKDLLKRLQAYLQKAFREAKTHTGWASPNTGYENAVDCFVAKLFDEQGVFWEKFNQFQKRINVGSIINSLSQLILKCTCPGVPDIYQGAEFWELSLVDPDNRRAVNYEKREKLLNELNAKKNEKTFFAELWTQRDGGAIKLWLTNILLLFRKSEPGLFLHGQFIPLEVKGKDRKHVIAFARHYQNTWLVIVIPIFISKKLTKADNNFAAVNWSNTHIILPKEVPLQYENIFSGSIEKCSEKLFVKDIFNQFPFAILKLQYSKNPRGAGVLLHITSLPSDFGVGDFGKQAKAFADFLSRTNQKLWQILPLNPTEKKYGYSPYSSYSSMAGNTLLIAPEWFVENGLLNEVEIEKCKLSTTDKADFEKAEQIREDIFRKAYETFLHDEQHHLQNEFKVFCDKENYWLHDVALFIVLRKINGGRSWHEWDDDFKNRSDSAIQIFTKQNQLAINQAKWLQFVFHKQWESLKLYCNSLNIKIFGDLPFYVSYDSADVWANPEIFCLDKDKNICGIAGVPPDYFSATGQLWGMPTYNWNVIKQNNYQWWKERIRRNFELYDLLRIDHFRAFAAYWQVSAGAKNAVHGEWIKGPGEPFFEVMNKEFGKLSFVAEDLGYEMKDVYALRDNLDLPGMKVLQFAFSEDISHSVDIPHNFKKNCIVYTGTHDNNTALGWFAHEANKADRKRMQQYLQKSIKIKHAADELCRMAYSSIANTVILPMQDVLNLSEETRFNIPGTNSGNWLWRLLPEQIDEHVKEKLRTWTSLYNRI